MLSLKVHRFPDPILKQSARLIRQLSNKDRQLIDALFKAMREFPHCVGIAAPQMGHSVAIAVMDASLNPKGKKEKTHGPLALINPVIVAHTGEATMREGCLSVPDFTGNTRRYAQVTVETLDVEGITRRYEFLGFEAIVAQHEIDHLNGLLFLDRVANLKADVFARKTYR